MQIKTYPYLAEDAEFIRKKVFMEEQGFQKELDDIDEIALHLVMYNEKKEPIAVCRIFEGTEEKQFVLGRLAVVKAYRGKNIGAKMIQEAEKQVLQKGGNSLILHAQCRAKGFYEKSGYREFGKVEDEEGCPHIWMKKQLEEKQ